jgi:hypothetical protein
MNSGPGVPAPGPVLAVHHWSAGNAAMRDEMVHHLDVSWPEAA